jgi:hypothetical protein
MEGFDTMTMSYLASPLSLGNIQGTDYLNALPPMDLPDQRSNFDTETFVRCVSFCSRRRHRLPIDVGAHVPFVRRREQDEELKTGNEASNGKADEIDSGDDMAFSQSAMPPLRRFSSYEDAFASADVMAPPFETLPSEQQPPSADSSIDHNHRLLSFSLPIYSFTLLDYSLRRTSLSVSAQLHGMFFLAESPWTTSPTEVPPPQVAELTCYRRNLFQITGSVTLPRNLRYIMTDQGDRIPILAQELTVSATESVEGNPVKIISVPWKTPAAAAANATGNAPPPAPEEKAEKEPPSIPLDTMAAGQDMDSDYATFPVAWKRLQFRIATANNGRRKELQQHFVVRLKVVATLSTGAKIPICEVHSGPVIVRGRSPRNFQSRKDLPLSSSAASSRKNQNQHAAAHNRASSNSGDNAVSTSNPQSGHAVAKIPGKSASPPDMSQMMGPFDAPGSSPSFADWTQIPQVSTGGPMATPSFATASIPNGQPVYQQSSPGLSRTTDPKRRPSMATTPPVALSLLDDDFKTPARRVELSPTRTRENTTASVASQKRASPDASGAPPAKMQKVTQTVSSRTRPNRSASATVPLLSSMPAHTAVSTTAMQQAIHPPPSSFSSSLPYPSESADLLYEYFPLSMDDWQAPVDAVYRPHVVHHTNLPSDYKFMAARSRSKRYFAAEDVC